MGEYRVSDGTAVPKSTTSDGVTFGPNIDDAWVEGLRALPAGTKLIPSTEEHRTLIDALRLHRRYGVEGQEQESLVPPSAQTPSHVEDLLLQAWRSEKDHILDTFSEMTEEQSVEALQFVVENEDALYELNRIRPYQDVIPPLLTGLGARRTATLISRFPCGVGLRLLFGDYTNIEDEFLFETFQHLETTTLRRLIQTMASDADLVRRLGLLCAAAPSIERKRWFADLETSDLGAVIGTLPPRLSAQKLCRELGVPIPEAARPARSIKHVRAAQATAHGFRRETPCDYGTWIHIDEHLDVDWGRDKVTVDILRLDPQSVRIETTAPPNRQVSIAEAQEAFSSPPRIEEFKEFGLFQLRNRVEETEAIAAINGGFYFDYGHLDYSREIGLNCAEHPGLKFGSPFGWYVHQGVTLQDPNFSRCAFVVDKNGELFIGQVEVVGIWVGGHKMSFNARNEEPRSDRITYLTSLYGESLSAVARGCVAWTIVGGEVLEVSGAGQGPLTIPPTGCVIVLPEQLAGILERAHRENAEDPERMAVYFMTSLPEEFEVHSALACGPQLISQGELVVDFDDEEFGEKDSPVISFFLPRLVNGYRAARSFVGLDEEGQLLLGVVSGRSFGMGRAGSVGMTFGELAVLCRDLGMREAMALDGGGSSSLIARQDGEANILNVPTGGTDVGRGVERFIANGLLVFPNRNENKSEKRRRTKGERCAGM